jgi:D-alanyl-D-alanine-carboxypeptidase/D-alanyl-D-alanine-endopeptidase
MKTFRTFMLVIPLISAACALTGAPPAPASALPSPATATATTAPPATSVPAPAIQPEQLKKAMDALMSSFMQQNQVTACSVAVVYPDAATAKLLTLLFNYGTLSKDSKKPVNSSTQYEIGSITKLFTADLLAWNVQNGLMNLDDPVQKYLPSNVHVPAYSGTPITLRQLSTHTSGLPRNLEGVPPITMVNGVSYTEYFTDDQVFNFLNGYQLTRAPGAKWEYSNLAYSVLGMAEEQVGHDSYENLVESKIAAPLGLHDTRVVLSAQERANLAQGYTRKGGKAVSIAQSGAVLPAWSLRSTIQDLATYLAANIDPDQTALASVLKLTQQEQDKAGSPNAVMGLGWSIANPGTPREQFSKDGATAGFNAYMAFSRVSRVGFVALCAKVSGLDNLAPQIIKLLNQAEAPLDINE